MTISPKRKIGLVDYNLDNFHANTYLKLWRSSLAERGYEVAAVTATMQEEGKKWAEENGLPFVDSPTDLDPLVDCFVILAPSNPETHLGMCQEVFPFGKPTFVDKTFAPSVDIAKQIFQLAEQHGTPVQTTSALRTTEIQDAVRQLEDPLVNIHIWAGGASFDEYGIHPLELAVSCLGPDVKSMAVSGVKNHPTLTIRFTVGRVATIDFNAGVYVPFVSVITTDKTSQCLVVDDSKLFERAAAAILDFFDAGKSLVAPEETIAIHRMLEMFEDPAAKEGFIAF